MQLENVDSPIPEEEKKAAGNSFTNSAKFLYPRTIKTAAATRLLSS
jgi:hypothetical protein